MPVEQVKVVTNVGRTSLEALRDLAEFLFNDPDVRLTINDYMTSADYQPISADDLDDFCEAVAEGVDRIVVIDDDLAE